MLRKKSSKSTQTRKSSYEQLDTTGQESNNFTTDDSGSESVLLQEVLALEDLDRNRQLLFTNTVFNEMSQIGNSGNPQEQVFKKFKNDFNHAKTDLVQFVRSGDLESTKALLTTYPIPLTITSDDTPNQTLLQLCISAGHLDIIDYLLTHDHELLNIPDSRGHTGIHFAMSKKSSLLRHIISKHATNIDWRYLDKNNNTYLHYCYFHQIEQDIVQVFQFRFDSLCSPNIKGNIPLQLKLRNDKKSNIRCKVNTKLLALKPNQIQMEPLFATLRNKPISRARKERFDRFVVPASSQILQKKLSKLSSKSNRHTVSSRVEKQFTLADFRVLQLLGKGSFADVYKVVHKVSRKIYAMKCIYKSRLDHDLLQYCYNQKQLLAKLDHLSVVKLFCTFQNNSFLFMVMELCESGTLRQIIKQPLLLPEVYIRLIVSQLVEAIGYLHENCIIYRDLKPENTGIGADGHIQLLDLGLAKEGLRANSICGSHAYLAPEMIRRSQYSFALDWYMLGVVIYELVMKKTPFIAQDIQQLQKRILYQQIPTLMCVSPQLQDLLKKLLDKNPVTRIGYKADAEEIQKHPWFATVNWERVKKREYNLNILGIYIQKKQNDEKIQHVNSLTDNEEIYNEDFAYMEEWESSIRDFV